MLKSASSPTAMLDQLTPFCPGSFWIAIAVEVVRSRGEKRGDRKWRRWGKEQERQGETLGQRPAKYWGSTNAPSILGNSQFVRHFQPLLFCAPRCGTTARCWHTAGTSLAYPVLPPTTSGRTDRYTKSMRLPYFTSVAEHNHSLPVDEALLQTHLENILTKQSSRYLGPSSSNVRVLDRTTYLQNSSGPGIAGDDLPLPPIATLIYALPCAQSLLRSISLGNSGPPKISHFVQPFPLSKTAFTVLGGITVAANFSHLVHNVAPH